MASLEIVRNREERGTFEGGAMAVEMSVSAREHRLVATFKGRLREDKISNEKASKLQKTGISLD